MGAVVSMKSSLILLVVATVLAFGAESPAFAAEPQALNAEANETWRVVGVADGDTLTCVTPGKKQVKVRLHGIDAPERGQPYGNRSRQALSDLVFGKDVEVEDRGTDRFQRTVGRVTVGTVDVNREMVASGMAWHYTRYDQSRKLRDAEQAARDAKAGLWADPHACPPWEWRRFEEQERNRRRALSPAVP
jgi:endonuclease YncB( thermonuclease family)